MSAFVAAYTFSYDWYIQFEYHTREWSECIIDKSSARHAVFRHRFANNLFLAGETVGNDTVWRLSLDSMDDIASLLPVAAIVRAHGRRISSSWDDN